MKKSLKLIIVSLVLTFISCEKTDLTQNEENTTASKAGTPPASVGYTDVKSWYIDNGISNSCNKNILVFPSWDRYHQVIDYLDQQTEIYCDAFDATIPAGTTDEQYDYIADNLQPVPFDEDRKLFQFENNFSFCSLRKKIITLEEAWLNVQGDGFWDVNADPDNHFIDDDTERALLNEGVEVIIGPISDRPTTYTLYKFNADGSYYSIPLITVSTTDNTITNTSVLTALTQINNGTYIAGSNPAVKYNPPVVIPPTPNCKTNIKEINYEYGNGERIKRKTKLSAYSAINRNKIFASTKGYKKKNGNWKLKRFWIVARLANESANAAGMINFNCDLEENLYKDKNKCRRKVVVKEAFNNTGPTSPLTIKVQDNKIYSYHQKGASLVFIKDIYDMN